MPRTSKDRYWKKAVEEVEGFASKHGYDFEEVTRYLVAVTSKQTNPETGYSQTFSIFVSVVPERPTNKIELTATHYTITPEKLASVQYNHRSTAYCGLNRLGTALSSAMTVARDVIATWAGIGHTPVGQAARLFGLI